MNEYLAGQFPEILSDTQEAILLTERLYPKSALLNVGGYARIEGPIEISLLYKSIDSILNACRSLFGPVMERLAGTVANGGEILAINSDYAELKDMGSNEECISWIENNMEISVLEDNSLLFSRLIRTGPEKYFWYLKVHHAVFDGYSMSLFVNKVMVMYNWFWKYGMDSCPEVKVGDYSVYILDEKRYKASDEYVKDREYWKRSLKDISPVRMFDSLAVGATREAKTCKRMEISISRSDLTSIEASCKESHVTANHFFIGLVLLLNKIYNNPPGIIGIPVMNRSNHYFKDTLGSFVNVLPVYCKLEDDQTFRESIMVIKSALKDQYKHRKYGTIGILKELNTDKSLYNVTFSYQKNPYENRLGEAQVSIEFASNRRQLEDLAFHLLEYADGGDLVLALDYIEDVFPDTIIAGMMQYIPALIRQLTENMDIQIAAIPPLSHEGSLSLLAATNRPFSRHVPEENIPALFSSQVLRAPASTALLYGDLSLSYAELDEQSSHLARFFRYREGIMPGDLVVLQLQRTELLVVTLLAVLRSGAAYVPVSTDAPAERVAFILKDTGCKRVYCDALLREAMSMEIPAADEDEQVNVLPSSIAYVIYTSGSTGVPKGVMVRHRNVSSFFTNLSTKWDFREELCMGALTNYTFDISVLELLGPLCMGMRIVLLDEDEPTAIFEKISAHEIRALQVTPSRLNQLCWPEGGLSPLAGLEVLLVGGEPLTKNMYERLRKELPGVKVFNVYGPTETTIWSSSLALAESDKVSIGVPLEGQQIYILDGRQRPLPFMVTGEICIGGNGVAKGYLNLDALTTEKFIPDPFSPEPGGMLYRTGDLGRWMPDGNIEYLGRADGQIKIRGHRVEIGEIENILQQMPGLRQSAVICKETGSDQRLIAYIVKDDKFDQELVLAGMRKKLPEYMIPRVYVPMDQLFLNDSGKIDKQRLASLEITRTAGGEYTAPRNQMESQLADLWSELLEVDKVGIYDDFFEMGGNSLMITRILGRIRTLFGIEIPGKRLYEMTDIATIAEFLEWQMQNKKDLSEEYQEFIL